LDWPLNARLNNEARRDAQVDTHYAWSRVHN
jgi:hypothetical protein